MKRTVKIAPSILAADFLKFEDQVRNVADNGADLIHIDIMDGNFVPNITFGPWIVESVKKITTLPLDVHLMIVNPDFYLDDFANAGADILTVHEEACTHLHRTIQVIKSKGIKAGVSLNPATPLVNVENIISELDLLLIMSVNPGFGGQKFIENSISKITEARKMLDGVNSSAMLEVDGGINKITSPQVVHAGADTLVAGNAIFKADDMVSAMNEIKSKGEEVFDKIA